LIRIHRVYSTALPVDQHRIEQIQQIFRQNFPAVAEYAATIPDKIAHPFEYGYLSVAFVSETAAGRVRGFSLFNHFPEINASLLDFIAVRKEIRGGGIGSALYEATRDYLVSVKSRGLYLESLTDDPKLVTDPAELQENRKRLAFYEGYGAMPVAETEYETPIDDSPAPLLLFDPLGRQSPLGRAEARAAVRLILNRKYSHLVDAGYIDKVVKSFVHDPVRFRPPRYARTSVTASNKKGPEVRIARPFALVSSDRHQIHHVRERGYVERPARVQAILNAVSALDLFETIPIRHFGEERIRRVHDSDLVSYLKNVCQTFNNNRPVYPYVFPIRRPDRKPRELAVRAGYYCIDTFTPLDRNAYVAARESVDVALTAAETLVEDGPRMAYGVCRPPGHHSETRTFGGFCYFNNSAIAAHYLSGYAHVALLDLDFHHGNGAQDIFYRRNDVLTVSIHGHPNYAYPYFSGFADEKGEGPGSGYNFNYPLPENTPPETYLETLARALRRVRGYNPGFLVVSLGFDTMKGDPTGAFLLTPDTLKQMGRAVAALNRPTLVLQEGGYSLRNLRRGAVAFFSGFAEPLVSRDPALLPDKKTRNS
jgi:acetoin utilization deacetylase AcuC-like enzyme/GNAT superfamily N-acetyltransferase